MSPTQKHFHFLASEEAINWVLQVPQANPNYPRQPYTHNLGILKLSNHYLL